MTLVAASSTASATLSGTPSLKPATSAMRLVSSLMRARKDVSLGTTSARSALAATARRRGATVRSLRPPVSPRAAVTASRGRALAVAEAADRLHFRREDAVQMVEAQDL